jgi:hypothetical protein
LDTKNFLTRIFAQRDEVVIMAHKPDHTGQNPRGFGWNRGSFSDIDEAVANISMWDAEPETTIYFSVGAFANNRVTRPDGREKIERKQVQATWFKTLALDLDIGGKTPYATKAEGMKAMMPALAAIGMPDPMVISSGNGVHLYWPLVQAVSREHWEKASIAFRIALEEQGVVIDTSKIHDPSMVLRPVGTHHKKQQPWKEVKCVADCPDYDPASLFTILKPWFNKGPVAKKATASRKGGKSSILDAVLNSNDVNLDAVASRCNQVKALVESGGVLDAVGRNVDEPLWRASLGLAKHCVDVKEAVIKIAGKHPDFDLDASMAKLERWNGTGPTTCAKFEQFCAKGCEGCPSRGNITSPAQLSVATETEIVTEAGEEFTFTLPKGYAIQNNNIMREVKTEITTTDANGNEVAQEVIEFDHVSPYEMHITGVYHDPESKKSAFKMLTKYPMTGWKETEHEITVLATIGKDFSGFLLNQQIYIKNAGQQEKVRSYLMDYLSMVQQQAPTGLDFVNFGWQEDGSFMCGQTVLGSPTGTVDTRLRGPAANFSKLIGPHGERSEWVRAMEMLTLPGTDNIRASILTGTVGILGPVAGNATAIVSIYSHETTTGKSLSIIGVNSLIGYPKELFLSQKDTANALYKMRGVLNNLPCCIDEMTASDDRDMADIGYTLSSGREKISMTKERELREPAKWCGPTHVTSNISMYQKFENAQSGNDPLKARCLEFIQDDREFVATREDGRSNGYDFYALLEKNNGWAFPELVQVVIDKGGPEAVWNWSEASFNKTFSFVFEPQERFYRTLLIASWGMGRIGQALGMFPFDVKQTIEYMIDRVKQTRRAAIENKSDVFDTIGQYIMEHNDRLVHCTEVYGTGKEQVTQPAPEKAVARVKVVYDSNNPVMPGSVISINSTLFKAWLNRTKDSMDRVERELESNGALIAKRDRVTMFKGCRDRSPGQTHCLIVNLNHPRFVSTLTGTSSREQSPVLLAVLNGAAVGQ